MRIPICILLICSSLSLSELSAQNVDSLDRAIDGILKNGFTSRIAEKDALKKDSLDILKFLSEGSRLRTINSDSSLLNIRRALDLSLRSSSLKLVSLATQDLGGYFMSHEMYRQAMTCYLACLRIEEKRNERKRMADLYDELGIVYYYMEVFDKSLDYNQKALNIYQDLKDTLGIAST
jgi:tetratricopeptide (TPR) repeat protein